MEEKVRVDDQKRLRQILISGCVSTAFFCLLYLVVSPLFAINDDVMIESILSGSYLRPYPYAYYFSGELGWLISGLYSILPAIPWFGLFYAGCHVACMTSLIRFVMKKTKGLKGTVIASAFVMLFMVAICFQEFVLMHYTVLAALLGATGLFLFLMARSHEEMLRPIVYFLLCYLVRENVFFMLAPFIAIAFLWLLLKNGMERWREWIPKAIVFVVSLVALFTLNRGALHGDAWKEYLEYNDVRTEIYDYLGIHSEDAALLEYEKENVTKQDVDLMSSYNLALFSDGTGNVKALKTVAEYGKKVKQKTSERLVWCVKSYVHRFLLQKDDFPYNAIVILAYFALLIWYVGKKRFLFLIPLAGLAGYRSALWIYLFYKGRYPDRVIDSLYYLEIAFLAALLLRDLFEEGKDALRKGAFLAATGILLVSSILQVRDARTLYRKQSAQNVEGDLLISYLEERQDQFYFIDVYALVGRTKKAFASTGKKTENYLWMGGWMTRHPLYLEKLKNRFHGADNAAQPLLDGEAYLVLKEGASASKESVEKWIGATLVCVDEISGDGVHFLIYQVKQ